jgi:hypothetical protein
VQTLPWWLQKRTYCGTFIVGGGCPAMMIDVELEAGIRAMPPQMASMVGDQLRWLEVAFESDGEVTTPPIQEYYDSEDEEEQPVNFADFYPPLVSPFEAEDREAFYAERNPLLSGLIDSLG